MYFLSVIILSYIYFTLQININFSYMTNHSILCIMRNKIIGGKEVMLGILLILNLILTVITCIFAIKTLLVNFKESKSVLKNIGIIFFVTTTLILSLIAIVRVISIDDHMNYLISQGIQLDLNLKSERIEVFIYTTLGYLFFLCLWALHKNIIKEVNKTIATKGWDLNKYK